MVVPVVLFVTGKYSQDVLLGLMHRGDYPSRRLDDRCDSGRIASSGVGG